MCLLSQLWRLPDPGDLTFAAFMPRDKKGSFALPPVLRAVAMLPLGAARGAGAEDEPRLPELGRVLRVELRMVAVRSLPAGWILLGWRVCVKPLRCDTRDAVLLRPRASDSQHSGSDRGASVHNPGAGTSQGGSKLGASGAAGKGLGGVSLFDAGPLCSERLPST